MSHIKSTILLVLVFVLIQACTQSTPVTIPTSTITDTPTVDPATPAAATAKVATEIAQATANAKATTEALLAAQTLAATQATATVRAAKTGTKAVENTATKLAYEATSTHVAYFRQTSTADAIQRATERVKPMFDLIQNLRQDGYIPGTEGTYTKLADFDESWAQIDWYRFYPTLLSPTDYVLTANFAWESASRAANWFNSGCGFVFNYQLDGSHYMAYLALDGYVRMSMAKAGDTYATFLGQQYYGKVDTPNGSAKFTMVILQTVGATFFVNDKLVFRYLSPLKFPDGMLAYTLNSGTNKDFGTRCHMTNVELWEFRE